MAAALAVIALLGFILLVVLANSVKVVQEYERGVIFRLGRCKGAKGPGVFFVVPVLDRIVKVNLQIAAVPVASQAVITKDNVTTTVDAVAYFQVIDAAASVIKVQNWFTASQLVAQTTLRAIVGRHELDQLLSERDRIDMELAESLDLQTEPWGVKVHRVEIRDVGLPEQMQRAMARQAEAERERRAKIIAADGELQASIKLTEAAGVISTQPGALQLRQLQTMVEISTENSSTIVFPIPIEILEAFRSVSDLARHYAPPPASAAGVGHSFDSPSPDTPVAIPPPPVPSAAEVPPAAPVPPPSVPPPPALDKGGAAGPHGG